MRIRGLMIVAPLAAAMLASAPANSAVNLGFEDGDFTGWTTLGTAAVTTGPGVINPYEGQYFAGVEAGIAMGTYSTLSRSFNLIAGGTISGFAQFATPDYLPYNDDGYLAVNGGNLLAWSVGSVGDFSNSGWNGFTFTAMTAGTYVLEAGVTNRTDNGVNSIVYLDAVSVTGELTGAVPEPASWAMMVLGFGLAGATLRSRRSSVRFA